MKTGSIVLLAYVAMSTGALAAVTWPVAQSSYFAEVSAMLVSDGYSSIEAVDGEDMMLHAYDRDGSEVMLWMNPDNGTIDTWSYVSQHDQ